MLQHCHKDIWTPKHICYFKVFDACLNSQSAFEAVHVLCGQALKMWAV